MKSRVHLLDLFEHLALDLELPRSDIRCLRTRFAKEGTKFLTVALPTLAKSLLLGLETGFFVRPSGFGKIPNHKSGGGLPEFLGYHFCRIFSVYTGKLLGNPSTESIQTIRQVCEYAYKVDADYSASEEQLVVNRFVSTEREVSLMSFDLSDPTLKLANYMTATAFGDFSPQFVSAKHGPGATSNVAIAEKFEHKLSPNLPVYTKYADSFFFNAEDAFTRLDRHPVSKTFDYFRSSISSRVILVPKDSRGPRLISAEPCENQFIQQGIADWMVRRIESYPLTAGKVNFTDQGINQELARAASISKSFATLDLKDASDRNSLSLFLCVFGSSPALMDSILASRTPNTELPDGTKLTLSKFAPMGSALCFPVMAWTIYILLYSGFIMAGESASIHKDIYVYGDDIIVPNHLYSLSQAILTRYGFAINDQKSYSSGEFRESCGGDYFKGVDVSPKRIRKFFGGTDVKAFAFKMLTHGNEMPHYPSLQLYCWGVAERILGPLPFANEPSSFLSKLVSTRFEAYHLNKAIKRPKLWKIKSVTIRSRNATDYGHFNRVWRGIGLSERDTRVGEFDAPRKWRIVRHHKSFKLTY